MKRIKSLPQKLRPREKILKLGAEALTLSELISVILITGTKNSPVTNLSSKVAKLLKNNNTLSKEQLLTLSIGPSKTAQLLAVLELNSRLQKPNAAKITSAELAYLHSQDILHKEKESIRCFYLNARGEVLHTETLAVGSLNKANLLPREIFSYIKELPISGIILVHNHPSGDTTPSREDEIFTKRVKLAADILGLELLDHLVISESGWERIKIA